MKEITVFISDDLHAEICLLYEYLVIRKDPRSDLRFSELVGEIIKTGFPKLLKEHNVSFALIKEGKP